MTVAFDHRDPGTTEDRWAAAAPWRDRPELRLDADRVLVVAAHPDDETLGAAGLLAQAARRGIPSHVLVLTDGEAADPSAQDLPRTRRTETIEALQDVAPAAAVTFAGLPDGGLRESRDAVVSHVGALVTRARGSRTLLAAPWWGDGHRDHRIAGEVACTFAGVGVQVVGYPVWMWHWADPATVSTAAWCALALDPDDLRSKKRAIGRHCSQLTAAAGAPILHTEMRRHFERDLEVFVDAADDLPSSEGTGVDPSWFEAFYGRHADPWGLESRWYEQRKRELLVASLTQPSYRHTLELGCGTGLVTQLLAARSERVTAVDVVDEALSRAAERVSSPHVAFERRRAPEEWPDGRFDLIVLSELAYYWSPAQLRLAVDLFHDSLTDDGELVLCHWRAPIPDCALTGDDVHAIIAADTRFSRVLTHIEDEFVLEVLRPSDARERRAP